MKAICYSTYTVKHLAVLQNTIAAAVNFVIQSRRKENKDFRHH